MKKTERKVYEFGGIEELEFELFDTEDDSNLLLKAYARIAMGEGTESPGPVDPV